MQLHLVWSLDDAVLITVSASQVMDFVGREELVERAMAAITAPAVMPGEETNFR